MLYNDFAYLGTIDLFHIDVSIYIEYTSEHFILTMVSGARLIQDNQSLRSGTRADSAFICLMIHFCLLTRFFEL